MELVVKIKKQLNNFPLEVDFTFDQQHLGILGLSGCGKSMTLKCIAGIEEPDEGYISLNGRVLFDSAKKINVPIQKRNIGYCFQNYALFPTMNVKENIMITKPDKALFVKWVKLLAIEEILDHDISQCSGGQQQRVALARMFVKQPELILLDEPFSALDTNLKDKIYFDLQAIFAKEQNDLILVSHDKEEIKMFCDKALLLDEGKQCDYMDIPTLFNDPRSKIGAYLIGEKNVFEYCCEQERIYIKDLDIYLDIHKDQPGVIIIPFKAIHAANAGHGFTIIQSLKGIDKIQLGKGIMYVKDIGDAKSLSIEVAKCHFIDN
ncbi:MAG: ATP-binding cassette domain-containing protein [Erysipelotrichaceae bacterium]|nr:ATP-binding cassette domain-containing protein [Erysipelotrichaceae bacterium]MDY5251156.1 ATP-binding cassette domain-containing protein [Erysipelotrichaceae bacterium]